MTIQEAIKSGRKFKRSKHIDWMYTAEHRKIRLLITQARNSGQCAIDYIPSLSDILADDWEVKS